MDFLNIASWGLLLAGSFFCIVGGIGLIRLPDFFARIHGAGITDTLGASLVLAGLMVQAGLTLVTVKLVMVVVIIVKKAMIVQVSVVVLQCMTVKVLVVVMLF